MDKVATKVERLRAMLASRGVSCVECYTHDATCAVDKEGIRPCELLHFMSVLNMRVLYSPGTSSI